jgi:hypothetical protein
LSLEIKRAEDSTTPAATKPVNRANALRKVIYYLTSYY